MCNPELVYRTRGGIKESFNRGVICIVNKAGEVVWQVGDVEQVCYPRSALKLFQVLPLLEDGGVERFGFTSEEVALMVGSHNGEKEHVKVATSILEKIGLGVEHLQCGAQQPTLSEDRLALLQAGQEASALHNNCSGKHAGFLAMCVLHGWDIETYLDTEHPLQQIIMALSAEMHEVDEASMATGLDGCSAPIYSFDVRSQAIAYNNLGLALGGKYGERRKAAVETMVRAMQTHPHMVAGKQRYCTELLEVAGKKVIGKTGADGVYSLLLLESGWAISIKIDDGSMGPQYAVAQVILEELGLVERDGALSSYREKVIKNWARKVVGLEGVSLENYVGLSEVRYQIPQSR